MTSALSHSLITKEVFVLSVLGKVLLIDEKRLIIETEPKSFFTAPFFDLFMQKNTHHKIGE